MQKVLPIASIIAISSLFSACAIPTYFGKSSLKETQQNQSKKPVSNLLIVGAGSTAAHAFLDNLSDELIKLFNEQKIQCSYIYTGKLRKGAHVDISKVANAKYDSYLLINPVDSSNANLNKDVGIYAAPLIPGSVNAIGSLKGTQYKENFLVELYAAENVKSEQVWQSELKVNFDFATSHRYKVIALSVFKKVMKK